MAIFTAIGTAIAGALFAGSALAATVISSALAFGANLAISYLKRPKKRKYSAVQGETQFGGDVPVQALFGIGKTKGQRSFYAKWGKGNKFNAEVFLLANGWCDGLEPYVYFYGEKKNLVARPAVGNEIAHYGVEGFVPNGEHLFSIRFYDGRPGQTADMSLVTATAALGQTWKETSVNAGICYVVVQRVYNGDYFAKGKPDIEFVLRGLREYDPRKDSTVAGGSGTQRLNAPSTWVHTQNPAVHRLNYQLGLRAMISGRTLIGEGKSLGQLDLGTYFVAMNVCDTLRTDGKKTYQCSLWATGEDDHTEILKEFDDAMAGYGLNRRGLSGVIPGAPQVPVLEITADDIPIDRAKEIQYRKSAFERFNHLAGQFLSIEAMWNPESLTPVYVNADIAADGRNRQATNDFLQVTDPDIAQYLLNIRYRQNRKGGTVTLPVSRRVGLKVQEGEWVVWRGREWMISEWLLDEQFRPTLKLTETGADIYDDEDIEPGPVVIPPTPPINPSEISTVQNFKVFAGFKTGAAGFDVPTLRFTWDPPEDPTITAVRFQYQVEGTTEIFEDQCPNPESGEYFTTKNVLSGVVYVARATIITVPDRLKTWTPWETTATSTGLASMLADLEHLGQDVRNRLSELQADMDRELRPLIKNLLEAFSLEGAVGEIRREEMTAQIGDAFAQIIEERRVRASEDEATAQILTALSASVGSNLARLITEETARATADSALSQQIVQLTAQTASDITAAVQTEATARTNADEALAESVELVTTTANNAMSAVQTETTARTNGDNALAQSITQVQSQVDDVSADGYLAITAQTSGGTLSKIEIAARAQIGQAAALAALLMEVFNDGGTLKSRNILYADRTLFVSPTGTNGAAIIEFSSGSARLNVPLIGTRIIAGTLEADRIVINGVTTDRIAPNAVTDSMIVNSSGGSFGAGTTDIVTFNVPHAAGATLTFWCEFLIGGGTSVEEFMPNARLYNNTNSVAVATKNGRQGSLFARYTAPGGQTNTQFVLQVSGAGSGVSGTMSGISIIVVSFKR